MNEIEKNAGFEVYYMPIPDEEAPALDDLGIALAWVADCIDSGKKVLVHCRCGIGRTGTFIAVYLKCEAHSLKTALREIGHTPSIPMSRNQCDLLERYTEKLSVSKAGVHELQEEIEQSFESFLKK